MRLTKKHPKSHLNLPATQISTQQNSANTTQNTILSQSSTSSISSIQTIQSEPLNTRTPHSNSETIQKVLSPFKTNYPFGDLLRNPKPKNAIRILFKNINGIQKGHSWNELSTFSSQLSQHNIDICGTAETNLRWTPRLHHQAKTILRKHSSNIAIHTSSNKEECATSYQPGGTLTIIRNKLASRITKSITDKTNLGRWSGFKLRTNFGHLLNIITVYQPTKSDGIHTTYQQHAHYFRTIGIQHPDPRKLLLQDLANLIHEFNSHKEETIIMIDANDGLLDTSSLIPTFLSTTNLTSLIPNPVQHPATHARGSKCIDFIFGTPRLTEHVCAAGITPFFENPWPNTDHRGLFLDLNEIGLFGATLETVPPPVNRIISSKSLKHVEKFIEAIAKTNKIEKLLTTIQKLQETENWTNQEHRELESIDIQFTEILLQSEAACAPPSEYPWSPTLHLASTIYQYWKTKLHGNKNNIDVAEQLEQLVQQLPTDAVYQNCKGRSTIKQLKHARKTLINSRIKAQDLRNEHLELLQEISIEDGNIARASAIRQLANKERQARCWRMFKTLRQGTKSTRGISHILIPVTQGHQTSFREIYQKDEVDENLLHRNIEHFSQADGTPFTISPLIDIIGEDGCSPLALQILEGNIPPGLPKYPTLLLQKLTRVRDPIPLHFSMQDMCEGFYRWREKTTTSPSGKHLGIYRALITADRHLSDRKENYNFIANKCLQIQHLLMTLAITQCHTFQRWTVVHNFLLEKIPGIPRLDKLRVIHLYEADWSLIQKFFVAYKLNNLASRQKTIPTEQAGGRPGRSAIELAASRVFMFETMRLQRLSGAVQYNDAKACYDRVVENISNLALMKQGLPTALAKLHSQTFHKINYYIKNNLGIGTTPHGHNHPKPVYGVGQGSTDAPSRWGFLCDPLLELYKELSNDAIIMSPISDLQTNNKIAGFVDDTTILIIKHYTVMIYIILFLQRDSQTWERLLHTSGGKLEIQKCVFAIFKWTLDNWGRSVLSSQTTNSLQIRSSDTNLLSNIPQLSTTSAYKYVGIQIAPDGNMREQINDLKKKCDEMSTIFAYNYFNARDANQGYTTVFAPSVKYVLPVTSIQPKTLQAIQQQTVTSALSRLGFNKHMPRSVVFASKSKGGIGLLNLPSEQGTCQIQLLISHLRSESYLYKTIMILIESYQLISGISKSPLMQTHPHQYVDAPWLLSLQTFLQSINATIYVPNLTTISRNRSNDRTIMSELGQEFSKSDLECINACRLFLQVTHLSEICDDKGTTILQAAIKGTLDTNGEPLLWQISKSTLRWPHQPRPPQKSWAKWKRYLQNLSSPTFKLPPLGTWLSTAHTQRTWNFTRQHNIIVHRSETDIETYTYTPSRTRNSKKYLPNRALDATWSDAQIPVIPTQFNGSSLTCTSTNQVLLDREEEIEDKLQVEYQHLLLNPYRQETHLHIVVETSNENEQMISKSAIFLDGTPYALIYHHIPANDYHTKLTHDTYGCLIPILFCSTNIQAPLETLTLHLYCNTKQLTRRLLQTANTRNPTQSYRPEWDLLSSITSEANKYHRSHYIDCSNGNDIHTELRNQLLTLVRNHPDRDQWTHSTSTYAAVQLRINNERVSSEYTNRLRDAHTTPAIYAYYIEKYNWTHEITDNIIWVAHGRALSSLPIRMSKTITQLNHKWLPLNASYSINATGTGRLCPFCSSCDEDHQHFLSCSHPQPTTLWREAASKITTKLIAYDNQVSRQLTRLLSQAVSTWRTTKSPPPPDWLSPEYLPLFQAQAHIGWNHILHGRFTREWLRCLHKENNEGIQWVTHCIRTIWANIFTIWKARCHVHHGITSDERIKRKLLILTPKVQELYNKSTIVDHDERYLFNIEIDDLLNKPIPTIKAWVHKATLRIKTSISRSKVRKKQEKAKILSIHPFFLTKHAHQAPIQKTTQTKARPKKFLSTTLSSFFPQIRRRNPPAPQNDLYPP